jgi:nucleoside-diphosphate-sugar epimerase
MKILVTGGCGYTGSVLIPKLLKLGHKVICIDTMWFGNFLEKNKNLTICKNDIRNIDKINLKGVNAIIHLASIANDPMSELDKNLSWETSSLATMQLMEKAIKNGVKRIIYASSGSVYGIKKEMKVTEDLFLKPISLYNKVKMITERVLLSYKNKINIYIIRPATVCGFSKRMRFDVTVNALSYSALKNKIINVNGGSQIRPNIHIDDLTDLYIFFLKKSKKFCGIYNAGFENLSVLNIAKKVQKEIPCKIKVIKKNFDPRSYRLDSSKLLKIGFKPKYGIINAIKEIKLKFNKKQIKNNPKFYSILWLKKLIIRKGIN